MSLPDEATVEACDIFNCFTRGMALVDVYSDASANLALTMFAREALTSNRRERELLVAIREYIKTR